MLHILRQDSELSDEVPEDSIHRDGGRGLRFLIVKLLLSVKRNVFIEYFLQLCTIFFGTNSEVMSGYALKDHILHIFEFKGVSYRVGNLLGAQEQEVLQLLIVSEVNDIATQVKGLG